MYAHITRFFYTKLWPKFSAKWGKSNYEIGFFVSLTLKNPILEWSRIDPSRPMELVENLGKSAEQPLL